MNSEDIAIKVENVSKRYRIGLKEEMHDSFGGAILDFIKSPIKNYRKYRSLYTFDDINPQSENSSNHDTSDVIIAVKDVSFEVRNGEVVGIIGKNGAGKSTLLKILCRITDPTYGRAEIRGKVSSLLEVGTGFHPELTGRENVYLNATILGMTKKEVDKKFDEIVDFSGVEKFIDTPIKRYSSGMKVRLAFSVAAHLEAEILLIDEVLAVGDAVFQKKCLTKMDEISRHGRTILFVSHNMAAVQNLCSRVIVMDDGKIVIDGETDSGITEYMRRTLGGTDGDQVINLPRETGYVPILQKLEFLDNEGRPVHGISSGGTLTIKIHYKHTESLKNPYFGLAFETAVGAKVFFLQTRFQKGHLPDLLPEGVITCHIPRVPLLPGMYYVSVGCGTENEQLDYIIRARQLNVVEADVFGTGLLPPSIMAMVLVDADWDITAAHDQYPDCPKIAES
jgi:lipopolysaccharide transport system ATP-binding protein